MKGEGRELIEGGSSWGNLVVHCTGAMWGWTCVPKDWDLEESLDPEFSTLSLSLSLSLSVSLSLSYDSLFPSLSPPLSLLFILLFSFSLFTFLFFSLSRSPLSHVPSHSLSPPSLFLTPLYLPNFQLLSSFSSKSTCTVQILPPICHRNRRDVGMCL